MPVEIGTFDFVFRDVLLPDVWVAFSFSYFFFCLFVVRLFGFLSTMSEGMILA